MNKAELVDAIVAESGAAKNTVAEVLKAFEEVVVKGVTGGEKIVLSGFLSFERVERKARTARNPQTGEAIQVKASRAPKVSVGSTFKKAGKAVSFIEETRNPRASPGVSCFRRKAQSTRTSTSFRPPR